LRLGDLGYADSSILIGLSFAVVVATIVTSGFTIDLVARLLGVKGEERPGLLIVGATPWTIALAEHMHELETPVMISDASWSRLKRARAAGLPTYHGEILNEATEHNLDLTPFQVLVAATENEAYNALVCSEFAPEIGSDAVYQLGEGAEDDYRALPESLRGRALFAAGFSVADVNKRQSDGWVFRRTTLSEQFNIEDARQTLPDAAHMLLLLLPDGRMKFFTHASVPDPQPGHTIISFSPPSAKPAEEAARKRAATSNQKSQPA